MYFASAHRRSMLRALLALMLFAGLLGTAVAGHAGLTFDHPVAAAVDSTGASPDASAVDESVCTEDNAHTDLLHALTAAAVHRAWLGAPRPVTAHRAPSQWHASSELRPPIA